MATLQQLQNALVDADKAGATDDARALAAAIIKLKSQPQEPQAPQPKPAFEDPGALGTIPIAAGKTFDRILDGFTQMYLGARGESSALGGLKQKVAEKDAIYKPLQEERPFATGIGESLPSMIIPGGGAATWTGNALRMGASAAIPAALEYGDTGDRLLKATIAGGSAAAFPALGAAFKSAKTFAEPLYAAGRDTIVGRTLNRVAGDDAANVIQRLKDAKPLVPGSLPTVGQVAENGGMAAMERSATQSSPSAFAQRGMEQASARLNVLRDIAGDDSAIAAQKVAREAATSGAYSQAKNASYIVDETLQNLLDRPIVKKAMTRAKDIAENDGRRFDFSTTSSRTFSGVGGGQPVVTKQITGNGLQDLKMAMDSMLKDPASGIVGKEAEQARNLRGKILGWMETANPEFGKARTLYADMSKPINQMQIGQELLTKLQPALSDYGALGRETAATFAGQLRNSDKLVKNATGFNGSGTLESVMGPQKMAQLESIAKDLARKSNAQELGRGVGSDTFQKLAMQNIAEQSGMPRIAGGLLDLPVVSRATKWVYRDSDEMAQKVIAEAMLDPAKAAQLMEQVNKGILSNSPKLKKLLVQSGLRTGGLLGLSAVPQE